MQSVGIIAIQNNSCVKCASLTILHGIFLGMGQYDARFTFSFTPLMPSNTKVVPLSNTKVGPPHPPDTSLPVLSTASTLYIHKLLFSKLTLCTRRLAKPAGVAEACVLKPTIERSRSVAPVSSPRCSCSRGPLLAVLLISLVPHR